MTECPECGFRFNTGDNTIENIKSIISNKFQLEVNNYNKMLRESKAWSDRKADMLKNDYLQLSLLKQEIILAKNTILGNFSFINEYAVDSFINSKLEEEFGIIDIYKQTNTLFGTYGYKDLIEAKLSTIEITDLDDAIESTIDWLKEKLEIYI